MKKSKAIKIISNIISEVTYKELAEKRAIRILDELEELGMLPPAERNPDDPGSYFYHYWEPEES